MRYRDKTEDSSPTLDWPEPRKRHATYFRDSTGKRYGYAAVGFHPTEPICTAGSEVWLDIPFPEEAYEALGFFYGRSMTTLGFDLSQWMLRCQRLPSEKLPPCKLPVRECKGFNWVAYSNVFNKAANMQVNQWGTLTCVVSQKAWSRFAAMCESKGVEALRELMIFTWARPGIISRLEPHHKEALKELKIPPAPPIALLCHG